MSDLTVTFPRDHKGNLSEGCFSAVVTVAENKRLSLIHWTEDQEGEARVFFGGDLYAIRYNGVGGGLWDHIENHRTTRLDPEEAAALEHAFGVLRETAREENDACW